jgi:hypothetical protein
MTDLVNLAIKIQDSENQQLRQEVAELRIQDSENQQLQQKYRRNEVPKNDEQIHSAKETINYDVDNDVNNMICLFIGLMATLVILLLFVGGIVWWEIQKNKEPSPYIDIAIGDGKCDDRQNVAECRYDGNDCCLGNKNTTFCEDCTCHLGKCSDRQSREQVIEK